MNTSMKDIWQQEFEQYALELLRAAYAVKRAWTKDTDDDGEMVYVIGRLFDAADMLDPFFDHREEPVVELDYDSASSPADPYHYGRSVERRGI